MRKQKRMIGVSRLVIFVIGAIVFISCSKQVAVPSQPNATATNSTNKQSIRNFHLSQSRLVLLEGNALNQAIIFSWESNPNSETNYTVEAALAGSSFEEPVEISTSNQNGISFTVKDFNSQMSKLLFANKTGRVEFRVIASSNADKNSVTSDAVALDVTTYQSYKEYKDPDVFKIPGNYQGWNLTCAPKIVSSPGKGEYEGYVNFTNPNSQVLMVKGNDWEVRNTYTFIGADKFGFGGSMMSVFGGAGVYLFKANTNTNKWGYTKINSWGIAGSAVQTSNNTDPIMQVGENSLSWSVTVNLIKGNFRIRANNNDVISFGYKSSDDIGTPSYDGDNMVVKTAGNYTITLELGIAGNYTYSSKKNN